MRSGMMQGTTPYLIATLLTGIAGFVDAVGFLSLGHIYTANMSGNSVALGIQVSSQNWPEATRRIWPVIGYIVGLVFCRLLIEVSARSRIRSVASITLLCEGALLVPICISHSEIDRYLPLAYIGLLSIAMGIQNATLTHFSSLTINTGFVTGTLVKFAQQLTKYLTWAFDHVRDERKSLAGALADSFRQRVFRDTVWLGWMWVAYVFGACGGTVADYEINLRSLVLPIIGLIVLIAIDLREPFAIIEQQEQAKIPG